ncbi:hypothetical protein V5O48_017850 [Marasmius crinis-equi]|uniref:alpha-galactosidase n=1 Tax=Marasmius crinis-equi TaxID=585013 RepID=A0ABR3EN03_9AGAR
MISSKFLILALSLVSATTAASVKRADVTPLPANSKWDYQIGGAYDPDQDVGVVTRDRKQSPVAGKYNICYVNAFQTQPDEAADWQTPERDHLLLRNPDGSYFEDPDWPGEFILNTSNATNRDEIAAIVNVWLDDCKQKGFNAVEPDNLDTFTRTDDLLSADDNVAYAKLLATHAHDIGLAIGQKNAGELEGRGKTDVGFDFAVVEQCQQFEECETYTDVYGSEVLEVEYVNTTLPQNGLVNWQDACNARGSQISIIYRDVKVTPRGNSAYVYREC